jgi:hypothetical protein
MLLSRRAFSSQRPSAGTAHVSRKSNGTEPAARSSCARSAPSPAPGRDNLMTAPNVTGGHAHNVTGWLFRETVESRAFRRSELRSRTRARPAISTSAGKAKARAEGITRAALSGQAARSRALGLEIAPPRVVVALASAAAARTVPQTRAMTTMRARQDAREPGALSRPGVCTRRTNNGSRVRTP